MEANVQKALENPRNCFGELPAAASEKTFDEKVAEFRADFPNHRRKFGKNYTRLFPVLTGTQPFIYVYM